MLSDDLRDRLRQLLLSTDEDVCAQGVALLEALGAASVGDVFRGVALHRLKLKGWDLRGADLRGANIANAMLDGVDLRGADLSGVSLEGALLSGADLRSLTLHAPLDRAYLISADLRGAEFVGNLQPPRAVADLRLARLEGASLPAPLLFFGPPDGTPRWGLPGRLNPSGARADLLTATRSGWTPGLMAGLRARGLVIEAPETWPAAMRAEIDRAVPVLDLGGLGWGGDTLAGADLRGFILYRWPSYHEGEADMISLAGADLRGAVLRGSLCWLDLRGADLRGADLRRVRLTDCRLEGAALDGVRAEGALIDPCPPSALRRAGAISLLGEEPPEEPLSLAGAALQDLDLREADLRGADLRGADLRWADLAGAGLRGADLTGADLRGAWIDPTQLLAEGVPRDQIDDWLRRGARGLRPSYRVAGELPPPSLSGRVWTCLRPAGSLQHRQNTDGTPLIRADHVAFRGRAFYHALHEQESLRSADFSYAALVDWYEKDGLDLRGADLRGAVLYGVDAEGSDLREVRGAWSLIEESNLSRSDLRGADLRGAHLLGLRLEGADLSGVDLRGARLERVNLRGACLEGVRWAGARIDSQTGFFVRDLPGLLDAGVLLERWTPRRVTVGPRDLREARLSGADLSKVDLRGACLEGAWLLFADLRQSDLRGASFRGARVAGVLWGGAHLDAATVLESGWSAEMLRAVISAGGRLSSREQRKLPGALRQQVRHARRRSWVLGTDERDARLLGAPLLGRNLRKHNFDRATLRRADLRGANLRGTRFRGASLIEADLSGADMAGAVLGGARLDRASLRRVSLRRAALKGATLRGADLRGADLRFADLRDADLRDADLRGADLRCRLAGARLQGARIDAAAVARSDMAAEPLLAQGAVWALPTDPEAPERGRSAGSADLEVAGERGWLGVFSEAGEPPLEGGEPIHTVHASHEDGLTREAWRRLPDLSGVDLSGRDLRRMCFRRGRERIRLASADLRGADLRGSDLRGGRAARADLRGALASASCWIGADLQGADLRGADLREAALTDADLRGALLEGADLTGADLWGADLWGTLLAEGVGETC